MSAQIEEKEEAGFLDILVVLLKYRILIITGTVLAAICSGIFFLLLPALNPEQQLYTVEYTIQSVELPLEIERQLVSLQDQKESVNPVTLRAIPFFTLKNLVLESYKNNIFDNADISSMDDIQLMSHVSSLINTKISIRRNSNIITISCTGINIAAAESFLKSLTESVNNELIDFYSPEIIRLMETISEISTSAKALNSSDLVSYITALEQSKKDGEALLSSNTYLQIKNGPFISLVPPVSKRGLTKFVISSAFAFAFFCCLAFILFGIKTVKDNPEMKQKIINALHKG